MENIIVTRENKRRAYKHERNIWRSLAYSGFAMCVFLLSMLWAVLRGNLQLQQELNKHEGKGVYATIVPEGHK